MATCVYCNSDTYNLVCSKVHRLSHLVELCRWIIDAYVSDFYTFDHWERLPQCVREYFDGCSPRDIAWLLSTDEKKFPTNQNRIVPLYLLSLQCSVEALSLKRTAVDVASEEVVSGICNVLQNSPGDTSLAAGGKDEARPFDPKGFSIQSKASQAPQYKNGQCMDMKHIFRKHVKPKKQHEIQKLGQTISLLAETTNCNHVVDVGAGLGHLSRLVSFQHGLQVTTVEAADGHAPKAQAFDREMKKDIHKALLKRKAENMDDSQLLEVSSASGQSDQSPDVPVEAKRSNPQSLLTSRSPGDGRSSSSCELQSTDPAAVSSENPAKENPVEKNPSKEQDDESGDASLPQHLVCLIQPDIASSQFIKILQSRTRKGDSEEAESPKFVLAGLHACGDLTPTLLRVFTECPMAVGLASVACCYMKISASSGSSDGVLSKTPALLDNYPMSNVLKAIPHNQLSYEAREMACHFADAYRERLEKSPPHLKIHSYRAALQYLITRVKPDFKSGQARFVSKKGAERSFSQYAKENLQKVGIDFSTVPSVLLQECEEMTQKWMRVVGFYTLRLSLAPAVETLLLLDRMLFLFEKGIPSVLVPIFDSSISPRNFALLAQKRQDCTKL